MQNCQTPFRNLLIFLFTVGVPGLVCAQEEEAVVRVVISGEDSRELRDRIDTLSAAMEDPAQGKFELVHQTTDEGSPEIVELIADEEAFDYVELMRIAESCDKAGFQAVRISAIDGLQWEKFDKERFYKSLYVKPTMIAVMADLCPGCRNMRDRFWSGKRVLKELAKREAALFFGVGSEDQALAKFIRDEFDKDLPVMMIWTTDMGGEPIQLPKLAKEADVLQALEEKLPLKK